MGDTFKAVDGWTDEVEIDNLATEKRMCIWPDSEGSIEFPCTIIPGHWAERIESGELLTEKEIKEAKTEWARDEPFYEFLLRFIARKLRGEA